MAEENNAALSYNPGAQEYSEVHSSRLVVRLELAEAPSTSRNADAAAGGGVSYWDSLSGGTTSRTISQRKQPGKVRVKKVAGIHLAIAQITVTRAWNTRLEHREPLESLIKEWLGANGPIEGLRVKVTQMLMQDDGSYKDIDYYVGPIVSYEGPKGNAEAEDFAKETLVVDPEDYDKVG